SIHTADLNDDALADILIGNPQGGALTVLLNGGEEGLEAPRIVSNAVGEIATVLAPDINGDGVTDLLIADQTSTAPGRVLLLEGDGELGFRLVRAWNVAPAPVGVALADMNVDGVDDVLTVSPGGFVSFLEGEPEGKAFFFGARSFATGGSTSAFAVADF